MPFVLVRAVGRDVRVAELGGVDDGAVRAEFLYDGDGALAEESAVGGEGLVAALAGGIDGVVGVAEGRDEGGDAGGEVEVEGEARGWGGVFVGHTVGVIVHVEDQGGGRGAEGADVVLPAEVDAGAEGEVAAVGTLHSLAGS